MTGCNILELCRIEKIQIEVLNAIFWMRNLERKILNHIDAKCTSEVRYFIRKIISKGAKFRKRELNLNSQWRFNCHTFMISSISAWVKIPEPVNLILNNYQKMYLNMDKTENCRWKDFRTISRWEKKNIWSTKKLVLSNISFLTWFSYWKPIFF